MAADSISSEERAPNRARAGRGGTRDPDVEPDQTGDLFADPEDFCPPSPPPTTQTDVTIGGDTITLHLVGHSPLRRTIYGTAAALCAHYLETHPDEVRGRTVLELGAGAGVPASWRRPWAPGGSSSRTIRIRISLKPCGRTSRLPFDPASGCG